jgi:hypothetical protein
MINEIKLLNKRILYINEEEFFYDIKLVEKLIELGAIVDSFHMIPESIYFRIINKLRLPYVKRYISNFNNKKFLKQDYDYVLIRYGMQFDSEFFIKLRRLNPKAKFINFHWDSIRPEYDYLKMIKYFDKVFSFDIKDCLNHTEVQYLPLFYLDEYEEFRKNNCNQSNEIDVLFIGNWRNYERYHLIKAIENLCKQNQLRFYYYLYYPIMQQIRALRKGIIPHEAKHKFLSINEILNLFTITNAIIDFHSSFQTGLTIRTFETLGAGKKLITTNRNIINEPFYNPEYINILDINNLKLDVDFIRNTPVSSMEEKINNYSIKNYINQLLQ